MEIKIGGKPFLIVIALIVIGIVAWSVSGYFVKDNDLSDSDKFAKCLSEKTVLYVKTGCPACTRQKEIFGSSVKHLNMVDCKDEPAKCSENNIQSIPSWIIDGGPKPGVRELEWLAETFECELPNSLS